jgi:hypothetical protein
MFERSSDFKSSSRRQLVKLVFDLNSLWLFGSMLGSLFVTVSNELFVIVGGIT